MINFTWKQWIYVDAYIMHCEEVEEFFQYFADHHKKMIICVESAMELERLKSLKAYGYINDVVYHKGIEAIETDLHNHKRKIKDAVIITQHPFDTKDITSLGIEDQYGNLTNFLHVLRRYEETLYRKLISVNIAMMILLCISFFCKLPSSLAGNLMLVAIMILIINFFYGVSKGIFRLGQLFEMIIDSL